MAIRVVRFGSAREPGEGVRLGTVRRPPRGVKKEDYAKLDYFDVWLPELAPSAPLVDFALSEPFTLKRWAEYDKRYRAEMKKPAVQHIIATLAALSANSDFSVGCYCENPHYCHRSILKELLTDAGAVVVDEG
ncbi:MAG TPA: DUF488 family protein [Burkholderiales bacterium]|nr:DUF488 family protein [Burkholderiales bacterium]